LKGPADRLGGCDTRVVERCTPRSHRSRAIMPRVGDETNAAARTPATASRWWSMPEYNRPATGRGQRLAMLKPR
jgi:hypothetical protein